MLTIEHFSHISSKCILPEVIVEVIIGMSTVNTVVMKHLWCVSCRAHHKRYCRYSKGLNVHVDMAPCFNLAKGVVKISDESAFLLSVLKKALLIASQFA